MNVRCWIISLLMLMCCQAHASYKLFSDEHRRVMCYGTALYMESRGESIVGQRAVFDVVSSRAADWNKHPCDIVHNKGQFQWSKRTKYVAKKKWDNLYDNVTSHPRVLDRRYKWFYNPKLSSPAWARKMSCKQIGSHNFCREKEKV